MDAVGVVEVVFYVEFVEVQRDNERGVGRREEGRAEEGEGEVGSGKEVVSWLVGAAWGI